MAGTERTGPGTSIDFTTSSDFTFFVVMSLPVTKPVCCGSPWYIHQLLRSAIQVTPSWEGRRQKAEGRSPGGPSAFALRTSAFCLLPSAFCLSYGCALLNNPQLKSAAPAA